MPTTNRLYLRDRVHPTAQVSALPMPHDWPKFVMTLVATGALLMGLLLIQLS